VAKPKKKKGRLTAADLATYGIVPMQPEGPGLIKNRELETLDRTRSTSGPVPTVSESETVLPSCAVCPVADEM
jgi:hypothetical protein